MMSNTDDLPVLPEDADKAKWLQELQVMYPTTDPLALEYLIADWALKIEEQHIEANAAAVPSSDAAPPEPGEQDGELPAP